MLDRYSSTDNRLITIVELADGEAFQLCDGAVKVPRNRSQERRRRNMPIDARSGAALHTLSRLCAPARETGRLFGLSADPLTNATGVCLCDRRGEVGEVSTIVGR